MPAVVRKEGRETRTHTHTHTDINHLQDLMLFLCSASVSLPEGAIRYD